MQSEELPAFADDALLALQDTGVLWSASLATPEDVVDAAVRALVDGVDSPALRELAGAQQRTAYVEVPELWPQVSGELDLQVGTASAERTTAKALARQLIRRGTAPRQIAKQFYGYFGFSDDALIKAVAMFDFVYDDASVATESGASVDTPERLDAQLFEAVQRLLDTSDAPTLD